ncbi:MAG: Ig domain-containing protein [Myxococcaceae bacterium]
MRLRLPLVVVVVAASCSSPSKPCLAGAQLACDCASGSRGIQVCNDDGSTLGPCVCSDEAAPSDLVYERDTGTFVVGVPMVPDAPSNAGGTITRYTVTPALPPGLGLNRATGVLSGTPLEVSSSTEYTVTGSNAAGSTQTVLHIAVTAPAPTALSYSMNPASYAPGLSIVDNVPSWAGGTPVQFSIAPTLPDGLTLSPDTGIISGVPTALTPAQRYVVTASNAGGSASATLDLEVRCPAVAPQDVHYVDGLKGADDTAHGGGPGVCALKTITYALTTATDQIEVEGATTGEAFSLQLTGRQKLGCHNTRLTGEVLLTGTANTLSGCTVDSLGEVRILSNGNHLIENGGLSGRLSNALTTTGPIALRGNLIEGFVMWWGDVTVSMTNNTFTPGGRVTCTSQGPNVRGSMNTGLQSCECVRCPFN